MQKTYNKYTLMNKIVSNIIRIRKQKGYTQDYMVSHLGIEQLSYARMESEETELTTDRLLKIADILETDVTTLLDSSKNTIQNQTNNEGVYGNCYVENLHIENKETIKKFIQILENENQHLKKEIEFLRSIIKPDTQIKE